MRKILYVIIGMFGAVVTSCNKQEELNGSFLDSSEAMFYAAPFPQLESSDKTTRVSMNDGDVWEVDDQIYIFKHGEITDGSAIEYSQYGVYKINDITTGKMEYVSGEKLKPVKGDTYHAFYSGDFSGYDNQNGKYSADVSNQTNLKPLLTARVDNLNDIEVNFQFKHEYAKLNFTFEAGGIDVATLTGATAKITGAYSIGDFYFNPAAGSSSPWLNRQIGDISLPLTIDEKTATATVMVIPMYFMSVPPSLEVTVNGKTFTSTLINWEEGNSYDFYITLGNKKYAIGDAYKDKNGNTIGLVYEVDATGTSGKIVGLRDAESGTAWSTEQVDIPDCDDKDDGIKNMKDIMSYITDNEINTNVYPAFKWVHSLNTERYISHKNYDGVTDGVWYLGAYNELITFLTVINNNESLFDFTDHGGENIAKKNTTDYYVSSTELGDPGVNQENSVYGYRGDAITNASISKISTIVYTRPIMRFTSSTTVSAISQY